MKIKRNIDGIELSVELTPIEMEAIYFEQQKRYDLIDVLDLVDGMTDEEITHDYGCTYAEFEDKANEIAAEMRRNIDKYDMEWSYAREEAVREVIKKKTATPA